MKVLYAVTFLAVFLAELFCTHAHAEGAFKAFYTRPEALSCLYWTKARETNDTTAREEESWVLGFASGVDLFWNKPNDKITKMKNEDLFASIDRQCKILGKSGYLDSVILDIIHEIITDQNSKN
jgi:hypothetical protein